MAGLPRTQSQNLLPCRVSSNKENTSEQVQCAIPSAQRNEPLLHNCDWGVKGKRDFQATARHPSHCKLSTANHGSCERNAGVGGGRWWNTAERRCNNCEGADQALKCHCIVLTLILHNGTPGTYSRTGIHPTPSAFIQQKKWECIRSLIACLRTGPSSSRGQHGAFLCGPKLQG